MNRGADPEPRRAGGTATVILEETVLRCRAEHPAAARISRFRGRIHGVVIIRLPFRVAPTGRILSRRDEPAPGTIAAWCDKCRVYTEYGIDGWQGTAPAADGVLTGA